MQIGRANFAVRGPTSLYISLDWSSFPLLSVDLYQQRLKVQLFFELSSDLNK